MPDAAAQGSAAAGFRYTADQLACVSLHETSHGRLDTQTGAHLRHETLGRDGVLQLRARPAGSTIAIEAWYDSLALSRVSPETTLSPDTDGLLGGRYRGQLSPVGGYSAVARPFVPDEVAEVADQQYDESKQQEHGRCARTQLLGRCRCTSGLAFMASAFRERS